MKPRVFFLSLLLLSCLKISSQNNLVLNPSFENYSGQCIFAWIGNNCNGSTVPNWYDPTGSPSYWFNSCNNTTSPDAGVPSNYFGYQDTYNGQAYSIVDAADASYRGYITGQFSAKLLLGRKYCVNFHISHADSNNYAVSAIGAFISDTAPCIANYEGIINCSPQIENPLTNILSNKKDWIPVSGEYFAKGGEQYIILGDFYSDSLSHYTYTGGGGRNFDTSLTVPEADYFVDEVSVRLITFANAYNGKKDTNLCNGSSLLIGGDSAIAGVSYQWLPITGLQNPNAAQTQASPTITTTYTLIVHNDSMQNCLCADSVSRDSVTIRVITINGYACCDTGVTPGQLVELNASGGASYVWSPPTGNCDTCPNTTANPTQTTIFTVTIGNDSGCYVSRTVTIDVSCGQVFIPTAFSPDNGGHNNILYVRGDCITSLDFVVFDRWGNKVFESQNLNTGWDGTYKGKPMNTATFMWHLTATLLDGTSIDKTGNVALVR